jgi:hypothetical protein
MFDPHPLLSRTASLLSTITTTKLHNKRAKVERSPRRLLNAVGKQSPRCRLLYCAFGHNCSGRRAACETQVVAADTAASTEGADRFPRILSPSGEADPPFAKRATSRQRLPVRAPRELASFVREFPHKEFQSGVRAAETVSGGAVALESALASASASPLASGLSLVLGLSSALALQWALAWASPAGS